MNRKIAITGLVIFALVSMGVGCTNNNQTKNSESVSFEGQSSQDYVWAEQGIKFKYPTGLVVIKGQRDILSFFPASTSQADITTALETIGSLTALSFRQNTTVDAQVQRFGKDLKSHAVEKINNRNFTKIEVNNGFTGNVDTFYFLPFKNGVLTYKADQYSSGNALLTLSSLEF